MQQTRLVPVLVLAAGLLGAACTATTVGSAAEHRVPVGSTTAATAPSPAAPAAETRVVVAPMPSTTEVPESPVVPQPEPEPQLEPEPQPEPEPETEPEPTEPEPVPPSPVDALTTATTEPGPDPAPDPAPGSFAVPTASPDPDPTPVITIAPVLTLNPCGPIGAIPDTAAGISSIQLDATGDGSADDVATAFVVGGVWTIRLVTSNGSTSELFVDGVGPGFVEVLGAVAIGDGDDEKFLAVVGAGASGLRVGVFGADAVGCLVRFDAEGGDPLEFFVGATIGSLSGVRCGEWAGGHYLESVGAADQGGGSYNVYGTIWHQDDVDSLWAENGTHLFGQPFDEVEGIATIDCPGITL